MKILGTRVLIEIDKMELHKFSQGGIEIPEMARYKPTEGTILAIGNGRSDDKVGNLLLQEVKIGDRVRVNSEMGSQHTGKDADGLRRRIFSIHDVLALLIPENAV